jgi:alkylation response protein AidB-like acyl-CoA dehydrogenase
MNDLDFQQALASTASRADRFDQSGDWPRQDLDDLAAIGAMRWAIPHEFGGDQLQPLDLHERYEQIAASSLATALILTQRDSAIQILAGSTNFALRNELLTRLARNESFTTVGIAQLTTSRQGGAPALRARRENGHWRLDGIVPWSTGAAFSSHVVVGAAVDGASDQILVALEPGQPGVRVDPPLPLVALRCTHTTLIRCDGALIDELNLIKGPSPNVLAGRKHTLPAGQAFLALGLCRGAIHLIQHHDSELARSTSDQFLNELSSLRADLMKTCDPSTAPDPNLVARVRGQCNDLAIRVTHAAVAIYKGTALLAGHPAQRLAREAMFLLVWSCPNPVIDCTVQILSTGPAHATQNSSTTAPALKRS